MFILATFDWLHTIFKDNHIHLHWNVLVRVNFGKHDCAPVIDSWVTSVVQVKLKSCFPLIEGILCPPWCVLLGQDLSLNVHLPLISLSRILFPSAFGNSLQNKCCLFLSFHSYTYTYNINPLICLRLKLLHFYLSLLFVQANAIIHTYCKWSIYASAMLFGWVCLDFCFVAIAVIFSNRLFASFAMVRCGFPAKYTRKKGNNNDEPRLYYEMPGFNEILFN